MRKKIIRLFAYLLIMSLTVSIFVFETNLTVLASTYVNVALGKTATSSSNAGASYTPNKAVDGNINTSFMQSTNVYPSWWQVDLALPYRISQIEIEKRYDSDLSVYKANFTILASNDSTFTNFTEIASLGGTAYTSNVWNAVIADNTPYRYVRLVKISNNASFSEFRVLVDSEDYYAEVNVVKEKVVLSASYGTTTDAAKINDDNLDTYWGLTDNSPTYDSPKWLIIDLGSPYLLSRLECVLYNPTVYNDLGGTYFYASNDPAVPSSMREQLMQVPTNWSGPDPWSSLVSPSATYRYIMLYKPSGNIMLKEFRAYSNVSTPKVTGVDFPTTTDVASGKELTINFNTAITESTINSSNIQLTDMSDSQAVSFSVSSYTGNQCKLLLPQLKNNNTYKLTVGTGITNITGIAMPQEYENNFITYKSYEVKSIEFTDNLNGTGQPLALLSPLAQVGAKAYYKNYSWENKDAILVIAFQKDGKLLNLKMDKQVVNAGQTANLVAGLTAPADITGLTVKTFLWDRASLSPFTDKQLLDSATLPTGQTAFYVSALSGSDTNLGTHNAPFATIQKAQQAVKTVNSNMQGDIYVYIKDGRYELPSTLTFGRTDSGTNGYNIFYKAYPGHNPAISGGRPINQNSWQQYSGNIYKTIISDNVVDIRQLYVDGKRKTRARSEHTINAVGFYNENNAITGIRVETNALPTISNPNLAEIVWPTVIWRNFRVPVSDILPDNTYGDKIVKPVKTIMDDVRTYFGSIDGNYPFYIENALELLDEPGEFYFNRATKELYYMPEVGEDICSSEVYYPNIFKLIDIKGDSLNLRAHNITFDGLIFEHSSWTSPSTEGCYGHQAQHIRAPRTQVEFTTTGNYFVPGAIRLEWADNINFTNNKLRHIGSVGFSLMDRVENSLFEGNIISDISDSAMSIGNYNQNIDVAKVCKNIMVRNNVINGAGAEYFGAPGIQAYYTDTVTIDHNIVANVPYSGIGQGWGWANANATMRNNAVTNNFIFNSMMTNIDGGGIYTLGSQSPVGSVIAGSVISGNYIKNQNMHSPAIYNDQGSKYYTITNNVSENVPAWFMD